MSTIKVSNRLIAVLTCGAALCLAGDATAGKAGSGKNTIRSVDSRDVGGSTRILIRGSSTPTFTVYKLDRPARVVVDVASSTLEVPGGDEKGVWSINSWAVGEVSAHPLGASGASVTRVVVGLARPATYKVDAVGNDVRIIVTPRDKQPAGADPAAAARAEADARAARADAAKARRDASAAQADAARQIREAKADAERAQQELAAAKASAESAVKQARADAEAATRAAEARNKDARARMARAAATMAAADKRMAEASTLAKSAQAAEARARTAMTEAASQQELAAKAQTLAEQRRTEADRAAKAAERYRAEAAAARGDGAKADSLRERAERAAREAETRRQRAEAAVKLADQRRASAEAAATEAEQRRQAADSAARTADAERKNAEHQRLVAETERQRAETERLEAEKRRVSAEAAAAEAGKRANAARELRKKEELAHARATAARDEAEKRRAEAERASAALETSLSNARTAQRTATTRRNAAAEARKKADDAQRQAASAAAVAKARAEAERLEKLLAEAEADLGKRQGEVAKNRSAVARLEQRRDAAAAELGKLRSLAETVRTDRRTEEAKLAKILERRADEERQLAVARKARLEAEQRAAEAEQQAAAAGKRADAQALALRKTRAETAAERARVARAAAAAQAEEARVARAAAAAEAEETRVARAAEAAKAAEAARAAAPSVRVRDVSFSDRPEEARITLALSAPTKPRVIGGAGNRRIIELDSATLPSSLERTLDTSRYEGPVKSVSSYRVPKQPGKVRVVVELDSNTRSRLRRVGNDYYWEFQKPAAVASKASSSPRKAQSIPTPVVGGYGSASTPIQQQTVAQVASQRSRVYRGTKIDLDFRDADIHNLLRLLADVGGVNIVIPDEIRYKVTVRMRRVPWDQALEVILASKGLWYERNGNLYRIAPRKELDAEAQAEAERRAALIESEVPKPDYITLNYSNAKDVEAQIRPMLSPRGQVQVDPRTNTIVVIDVQANRQNISNLLARLDTPTPQIQIEARIVEARSTFVREIGVQWGGNAISSAQTGNATGLVFPNSVGIAGGAEDNQTNSNGVTASPSDFAVNLPAAVGTGSGGALGFALGSVGGNFNLSLRLSALEDQGTVRIVSAPKITVVNNVTASISQGVSIPVSVISANGVQTQFVPADLALEVTPTVSQRDCAISLDVKVKKNEADFVNTGARGDPTILRKEAQTRILVADGATSVIGGIYTRNTGLSYSKVPFFGDLPVFGWFFKNKRENDERTEVLVFITPKITNKASLRCE